MGFPIICAFQKTQPTKPVFQAPPTNQLAPAMDPNYQTLAGLSNDDIFKEKVWTSCQECLQ